MNEYSSPAEAAAAAERNVGERIADAESNATWKTEAKAEVDAFLEGQSAAADEG